MSKSLLSRILSQTPQYSRKISTPKDDQMLNTFANTFMIAARVDASAHHAPTPTKRRWWRADPKVSTAAAPLKGAK
jgi:hypothetical protein